MIGKIENYFLKNIDEKRWKHSLRVLDTALNLGEIYNEDKDKIYLASLLHDCAKFKDKDTLLKKASSFDIILDKIMMNNLELIHGPLGAKIAKEKFQISDPDILNAIKFHTTGRFDMSLLEKIIFIADFIEPERKFIGIEEVRRRVYYDLDRSIVLAIDLTIEFLISKEKFISIDSIDARNSLKLKIKERKERIDEGNR